MKTIFISDVSVVFSRKLGSKDKTTRHKKPQYGWYPSTRNKSALNPLLKASALPIAGTLAGGSIGRTIASRFTNKTTGKFVGGAIGAVTGNRLAGQLNKHTLNKEGYFTPNSKVKKYKTTNNVLI